MSGMINASDAPEPGDRLAYLRAGGKAALARLLARLEESPDDPDTAGLLDEAWAAPRAHVIGLTGPPGVGKSTLIDALIRQWRAAGLTVGVIAVDPSSRRTKGALLGDRIRMRTDPEDQGVFVRSLASRGQLGGLTEIAFPAVVLMRAIYDRVIVETVGVGQSEADISAVADTVVLCVQPGSGDSLQFMKAGIMEIPDIAVVTKSDVGPAARRALTDLQGAMGLATGGAAIACLALSATSGDGVEALTEALDDRHAAAAQTQIEARRRAQAEQWLHASLAARYGSAGLEAAAPALAAKRGDTPFRRYRAIAGRLRVEFDG